MWASLARIPKTSTPTLSRSKILLLLLPIVATYSNTKRKRSWWLGKCAHPITLSVSLSHCNKKKFLTITSSSADPYPLPNNQSSTFTDPTLPSTWLRNTWMGPKTSSVVTHNWRRYLYVLSRKSKKTACSSSLVLRSHLQWRYQVLLFPKHSQRRYGAMIIIQA